MPSPTVLKLLRNPLFLISATTLICLLISASLLQQQHHQRLEIRTDQYGNALASLAASQATEATMNHDLVSLQVTVSEIARNPDILSVTVHDVENRLLVQAGDSPNAGDYANRDHQSYTSPVTLQDSIAGYVTVTIDTQTLYEKFDDTWLMALLGLAGAMLVLSIINQRQAPDDDADTSVPHQKAALAEQPDPAAPAPRSGGNEQEDYVTLKFCCLNWPSLKQQLSATLRQQLFDDLQGHLSGINALYSGRITLADHETLELEFHGDEIGNTTFRAICAAQLLFTLLQNGSAGIRLRYAAAVYHTRKGSSLSLYLAQAKNRQQLMNTLLAQPDHGLLLDNQNCATAQLLQRLQTGENLVNGQWISVEGLRPSYQGLLDKQAKQLLSLQTA
ncbi:hypothetical protein KOI40_05910 [Aestuariicella sp. G3-2]|uniref:hypothetical protein n=1 Tax=Pseudomaricurvus albidus TaxID=2842452 RepID=UPI001C0B82D2|nr:hypothetical protein [Aestuariicella albida]MBU3069348.1 hypothetical protein [Aestuariicella albida]